MRLLVGVPDEETWSFTHNPTPKPAEGEVMRAFGVGPVVAPSNHLQIVTQSTTLKGFTLRDHLHRVPEALEALSQWMDEGRLVTREHILEGIEQFPAAVRMIFTGENRGKLLIRLSGHPA